jgi:hypothetical protein
VSGGLSIVGLVGVLGAVLHVLFLGNLDDEEIKENHNEDAFVQSLAHCVPHFVVKAMDFLHALHVVASRGVGEGPHTEVVHVRHVGPAVLELNVFHFLAKELVAEAVLAGGVRELDQVTELLTRRLKNRKFVHL